MFFWLKNVFFMNNDGFFMKLEFSESWKNNFFQIVKNEPIFRPPRIDQISDRLTGPTKTFRKIDQISDRQAGPTNTFWKK